MLSCGIGSKTICHQESQCYVSQNVTIALILREILLVFGGRAASEDENVLFLKKRFERFRDLMLSITEYTL